MLSSKKRKNGDLAKPALADQAKELLKAVANLRDDDGGFQWFQTNFPYVLEDLAPRPVLRAVRSTGPEDEPYNYYAWCQDAESKYRDWLLPLRKTLREIWRAPDKRTKEWGMFRVSQDFFLQGDASLIFPPLDNPADILLVNLKPPGRTERLLLELMRWAELTHYCDNQDCPAPYFIASRRSQKYCSEECSKTAQQESKRRWWAEKGTQWRRNKAGQKLDSNASRSTRRKTS